MGDLKTNWSDPILGDHGVDGQGVVSRGSDPNADGGDGPAGLTGIVWPSDKQVMGSAPSGQESANSESGLPAQPNRFEPSGDPPQPPSLQDRNPGTIDQR